MRTIDQIQKDKAEKETELRQLIVSHQQLVTQSQARINFCEGQIDALEHVLKGEENAAG